MFSQFAFFKVDLTSPLAKGGKVKLIVVEYYTHKLTPYPTEITQAETQ